MESLGKHCTQLKLDYEHCFNKWYSEKYLKGEEVQTPCKELFELYSACVTDVLKQKGIKDLIDDARKQEAAAAAPATTPPPPPKAASSLS